VGACRQLRLQEYAGSQAINGSPNLNTFPIDNLNIIWSMQQRKEKFNWKYCEKFMQMAKTQVKRLGFHAATTASWSAWLPLKHEAS